MKNLDAYAKPKNYVYIGLCLSFLQGSTLPLFALFLTKALFKMQIPDSSTMYRETSFWILLMFILALASYLNIFIYKYTFGIVGGNIIRNMRKILYNSFLEKHIGWFDNRAHSPGILTTVLASDVQILNGVS